MQATEAVILGTLCTVGMLILRPPYAPMIGALVGVTALIPIVGAFIGMIAGAFLNINSKSFESFCICRLSYDFTTGRRKLDLPQSSRFQNQSPGNVGACRSDCRGKSGRTIWNAAGYTRRICRL